MTLDLIEVARLDAVRRYDILDTPPDQAFDRITALAARACDAPIAIVSIVDEDRIWFKSHHGLDVVEIGRDSGLCASAILHDDAWIVENAITDPRTLANPLVAGEFGLRFYLGVPLRTAEGHNLGTLCVLDFEPRRATDRQIADLTDLAAIVMDELELRLAATRNHTVQAAMRERAESLARLFQDRLLPARLPALEGLQLGAHYEPADRERVGGDFYDAFITGHDIALVIGDVCGHGPHAAAVTSLARHTIRALCVGEWAPADVLEGLNRSVIASEDGADPHHCTVALLKMTPGDVGFDVTVALGGHPFPLVLHPDGSIDEVGVPGLVIGCFDSHAWNEQHLRLAPGDTIVLFTDGLTEASGATTAFGEAQLHEALRACVNYSPDVLARSIVASMRTIESKPRDDVAILAVRVDSVDAGVERTQF